MDYRGLKYIIQVTPKKEMNYYLSIAAEYGLLVSGGSDFHGKSVKPDIELGTGKKIIT